MYGRHRVLTALVAILAITFLINEASAQTSSPSTAVPQANAVISPARNRALNLWLALTSVAIPIDDTRLVQMETFINKGDEVSAVRIVTADPLFYDIRVRDMARKMSTRAETAAAPLSDFVATFIGIVKDSDTTSAKEMLTGNFTYQIDPTKVAGVPVGDGNIWASNNHYQFLADKNLNTSTPISISSVLKKVPTQRVYSATISAQDTEEANVTIGAVINHPDPAGLLTTYAFQQAHANMGTNRRLVEFTFREFMCVPMASWSDKSAPDDHVGRDVPRNPSGKPEIFTNTCRACHAQMDGMRPAFAYNDFRPDDMKPVYYSNGVAPKYARNKTTNNAFNLANNPPGVNGASGVDAPIGFRVPDNNFINYATEPNNMRQFGWRGPISGKGLGQFAAMIANSQGFSRCMAKKVFSAVCKRDPVATEDPLLQKLADDFESDNYHLRHLFESVAMRPECVGL